MNPQCPWDAFEPSTINFCEEKLCAWIVKPAETWSNIGFALTGLLVIYLARKENREELSSIGLIGIVLGIFSGLYHATGTRIGGLLDITSMFLFTALGIAFNLKRLKGPQIRILPVMLAVVLPSSLATYFWQIMGLVLFGVQFVTGLTLEYLIHKKKHEKTDYTQIKIMIGVFAVAWGVWWLDITKIWCDPANHFFSGHALWHLMTGTTFYFIYRFYSQFGREKFL